MKRHGFLAGLVVMLIAVTGTAWAEGTQSESIKGRLGITGRVGGQIPAKESDSFMLQPESSFAAGGGLIFGITDMLAIEADVAHMPNIEFNNTPAKLHTTDVSIGLQLRNRIDNLTGYLGIGADVLFGSGDFNGTSLDMDTTYGGHIRGGADYFLTRNVALNLDLRGSFFPNIDITRGGVTVAEYNPVCFIGTVGVRVFLY